MPGFVISKFYDSRLLFENPADGPSAQTPKLRNLINRIVLLEGIAWSLVLTI